MTTSANDRRIEYVATSGQTVFPYDFEIIDQSHIVVIKDSTTLTITTDYTVSGVGSPSGGNITLTSGADEDDNIIIFGDEPLERTTDFSSTGNFLAATLDEQLDSIVRGLQQIDTSSARVVKLKDEDTASTLEIPVTSERSSKFLAFDASGNAIAAEGSEGTFPVSAFGASLIDDADAATARATLGVTSNGAALDAIDALTPAADRLAYFTSSTAASLATITAFARTMLDDVDAAAARVTLGLDFATQAEMEGETADKIVTADNLVFAPTVAKAWCVFNGTLTGTNSPTAGYNVASVTRNSAGNYTVNIDDNLSSGAGAAICSVYRGGNNSFVSARVVSAGAEVEILVADGNGSAANGNSISVVVFGDQ